MWRKYNVLIILFVLVGWMIPTAHAAEDDEQILFVYTSLSSNKNVKKLDLLLHHFSTETMVVEAEALTEEMIGTADYVVVYQEKEEKLPQDLVEILQEMEKPFIFIGENVAQVWPDMVTKKQVINSIGFTKQSKRFPTQEKVSAHIASEDDMEEVLLYGFYGERILPLMMRNKAQYYLGVTELNELILQHLAELLHDIIDNNHIARHEAYIRLENIHPLTNAKKVQEVVELLETRQIPYVLAVQLVYTNPETGDVTTFKDADDLLKVIHEAQKANGTVVVHGYTNDQELGYEFWDTTFDQPMISETDKEAIVKRKPQTDFQTVKQYEEYQATMHDKEREYVNDRLERAIKGLVKKDIYPIAFAPPYHLMSEAGYQTAATYFTALFGQVQLSDDTAKSLYAPPFVTTASFLQGMMVYPETIGDISQLTTASLERATKNIEKTQIVRDGMIGLSYQTYLGASQLSRQLDGIEQISGLQWLALNQTEQEVTTGNISIQASTDKPIQVMSHLTWKEGFNDWLEQFTVLEKVLWVVTLFVFIFVVLFLSFALHLRLQLKKRLFEERK